MAKEVPAELIADFQAALRDREDHVHTRSRALGQLHSEYAANLARLREDVYPRMRPLLEAVHTSRFYQRRLEARIAWLEQKLAAQRQHRHLFYEARDMAAARQAVFAAIQPEFDAAFAAMAAVSREELAVLRGYDSPPPAVLATIEAVMMVRGEAEPTFEESRVMLSETYYYAFFISKCRAQVKAPLSEEQRWGLERFLVDPDTVPANVERASIPCGAMARWLSALDRWYHAEAYTAARPQTEAEAEAEAADLRRQLEVKRDEAVDAERGLAALRDAVQDAERDLRARYDLTMLPLHDLFLVAAEEFSEAFAEPERFASARGTAREAIEAATLSPRDGRGDTPFGVPAAEALAGEAATPAEA